MNNKQVISQALKETADQAVQESDNKDFVIFQTAAQVFLNQIEKLSSEYNARINQKNIKEKIEELYGLMRQNTNYTREILQCQHTFENALDTFLGRTIKLAFVVPDGNIRFYGEAKIGELYSKAAKQWGRGNITKGKVLKMEEDELEADIKEDIQESMKNKWEVYREALARYNKNREEGHMHYSPSKNTFYWWAIYHKKLMDPGWTDPISNRGPIAEGYAGAVINQDPEIDNNDIEMSLYKLWVNHIQKDSIGAAIKGDIVLDSNGNIQFAVKSGNFSTARVQQYIALAYNILQLKNLTAQQLLGNDKLFYNLSTKGFSEMADQILDALNHGIVGEELDKIIEGIKV